MLFIDKDGNYPRYLEDLYEAYPLWTYKRALPTGWHIVKEVAPPQTTGLEMLSEDFPRLVDGNYVQSWSIIIMPEDVVSTTLPDSVYDKIKKDNQ